MKRRISSREMAIAVAVLGIPFIIGCGSSSTPPPPVAAPAPVAAIPPQCAANPYTPGCPAVAGAPGQCVPVTGAIPFTGSGIYVDSANIRGGAIPATAADPYAGQTFGVVVVGGAAPTLPITVPAGSFGAGTMTLQRAAVDATISMQVTTTGATVATTAMTATAVGTIQITNPSSLQELYAVASQEGIITTASPTLYTPTVGMPAICVSGVAFDTGYSATTLYGGTVYLFLNNTMHGWSFPL